MKIVVDSDIPFLREVLEPFARVVYLRGEEISPADVADADALVVRTRTRCDATLLASSGVRFIGTATIGFDHIDTGWCASRGITVATAAGSNARGVLQWVAAALAALTADRGWGRDAGGASGSCGGHESFPEPSGVKLGVVGVGNVGSLVARYAAAWGFEVMCSDPPRERAEGLGSADGFHPLDEIARSCDVITFHVPLTRSGSDATLHLVDRGFLTSVRPGAVIINSARGAVIEPEALREVVLDGRRGCNFIIDTWNGEPAIDRAVLERVFLGTPHIAGYTEQGKATATAMIVDALAREFSLPLTDWYPPGVSRSRERNISWAEMCRTMPTRFDIAAQSAALKASPELFETMRNNYSYREEYF